mgnify:CR=1 FL=1
MSEDIRLKRLRFRSGHRGCKETDIVLGGFAEAGLAALSEPMLALYEKLLEENDNDIWDWLTGKPAPQEYAELLARIQSQQ